MKTTAERCKQRVYDGSRMDFSGHQCTRKAVRDGFCNVHHPDSVKARQVASQKRYEENYEASIYGQFKRLQAKCTDLESANADLQALIRDYLDHKVSYSYLNQYATKHGFREETWKSLKPITGDPAEEK